MFHPVNSKANFPHIEEGILRFWKEKNVFERSVEARRGARRFTLYEGPPTANGSPGIHHVLSRAFKDIIPRYKTMKGYYAPRKAGWDTHGLPVELEVEKKLGFTSKAQIEGYGVANFNARCRESVFTYLKDWEAITNRIGYWIDLEHAYITMDNSYIETAWWAIKQMWDKGLVYQGYRVTPHCPRCGTSLSSHEVALGYRDDAEDPSVYIKFRLAKSFYIQPGALDAVRDRCGVREAQSVKGFLDLTGDKPVFLLAWTTTPWTLPGNTALAVAPDAEYAIVEAENEYLILASARLEAAGLDKAPIVARMKGSDLRNLLYEPLYDPYEFGITPRRMGEPGEKEPASPSFWTESRLYPVITGDFVSMEDGTGVVHIAPAYGEIDYDVGLENCLEFVHTVDLRGVVVGTYPFSGRFVKDADPLIINDLKSRGLLFRQETIRHTYPFCWRCDTPLLYYAKQTWYIKTTAVKDQLIDGNEEINWYPEHIKRGRFGDWLQNNVDWAFSRERYWGTPLPVWRCPACGDSECIGSLDDLRNKKGLGGAAKPRLLAGELDLHRPDVDQITYDCPKCGGRMERVPEVIDCWFDSGAMPVAQWHYPFENATLLENGRFPADYICEAVDQTRGWFYSLHAISTLLFGRPCFKNVICLGHILDAKGEKMSKARGNVVEPQAVINNFGADAVRWYFYTSSPAGSVRRFSEKQVAEARSFLLTLWNVYSFFVTYANIDRFSPVSPAHFDLAELDRWILSELNQLIMDVSKGLDNYDPTESGRRIQDFVENLSNWYVRRSRRRFWKSESDADKLAAYTTLYECLVTLSKLLAPFTPFVADEIYRNLVGTVFPEALESVHLTDFPTADEAKIDSGLAESTRLAIKTSSLGRAARSQAGIKVRQPIARVVVKASSGERESLERLKTQVLDELNAKELTFAESLADLQQTGYEVSSDGTYAVAISTEISPELAGEGMAREIVHRLQTMRRSAGFDIADYIVTYYQGDSYIRQIVDRFADYIKQETLSRELIEGVPEDEVFTESHKLSGYTVRLGVKKGPT